MGEGFAAEVADGCHEGVGGGDEWLRNAKKGSGVFNGAERSLKVGIGGFGAKQAEDLFGGLGVGHF